MKDILPGRLLLRRPGTDARLDVAPRTLVHLHDSTTGQAPESVPTVNFKNQIFKTDSSYHLTWRQRTVVSGQNDDGQNASSYWRFESMCMCTLRPPSPSLHLTPPFPCTDSFRSEVQSKSHTPWEDRRDIFNNISLMNMKYRQYSFYIGSPSWGVGGGRG